MLITIITSIPGAVDTAKHKLDTKNKNLFHSCGHGSTLQSRPGEPLCIFSPYLYASILQMQTVNHVRLVDVGEDVNHLQNRQSITRQTAVRQLQEEFMCTSVCDICGGHQSYLSNILEKAVRQIGSKYPVDVSTQHLLLLIVRVLLLLQETWKLPKACQQTCQRAQTFTEQYKYNIMLHIFKW